MRIYGSNIKKNYNKNNKHHKKIFKFLLISFSILVLLGNIIVLIFFCILSTIDVNENPYSYISSFLFFCNPNRINHLILIVLYI